MALKKYTGLIPARDPFAWFRQMASEFDRVFESPAWPSVGRPMFRSQSTPEPTNWFPEIDVFEKGGRLITKIDLPGLKKEEVKVEVTDGQLAISGERKAEFEEKKESFYRCEREYGSFYRAVPLPQGVKFEDIKATFIDGVLEVSVPMPVKPEATVQKVEIEDTPKVTRTAA